MSQDIQLIYVFPFSELVGWFQTENMRHLIWMLGLLITTKLVIISRFLYSQWVQLGCFYRFMVIFLLQIQAAGCT